MREIIFDTETTGLKPEEGHRIVELGGIELVDRFPTGRSFHRYINPGRDVPPEAFALHGLSEAFLADKPSFADVAPEWLAFVGEAQLVAHNAAFDIRFLDAEFARLGLPPIERHRVVDTWVLARRRHPGGTHSLDALCQRYGIDITAREKHGALLDARLLAEVYVELTGGRQATLSLANGLGPGGSAEAGGHPGRRPAPLPVRVTAEDRAEHARYLAEQVKAPLWRQYGVGDAPA